MGGLAFALAIALAVVITVLVVRPDSDGGDLPTPTNGASEFASAGDVGPVNIITEDPTCDAWGRIGRDYSDALARVSWNSRDTSVGAASWTPEQRVMYQNAAELIRSAAEKALPLAKRTPHRVMRELYEQFNAYSTLFVGSIPNYGPIDNGLVVVSDSVGLSLNNICAAITSGAASAFAPLVPDVDSPANVGPIGEATAPPSRFLIADNPVCSPWADAISAFSADTEAWLAIDGQIPASQWTPEQRAVNDAAGRTMAANSDELERLGRQGGNATLEDIAVLAAQYQRAYVIALPNYTAPDGFLAQTTTFLVKTVDWACKAPR